MDKLIDALKIAGTNPLTLIAFLALVAAYIYKRSVKTDKGLEFLYNLIKNQTTKEQFYKLANKVLTIIFTVAVLVFLVLFMWIIISTFKDKLSSSSLQREEIIVDGKVYEVNFEQPMSGVSVIIVDDSDNPMSHEAVTGTDGKFVLKTTINTQAQAFLLLKKRGYEDWKIPLNKEKISNLKVRYPCQAE
ncbi:hypothetical protein FJZ31_31840 [Candidatus Poribacteria bacterium]|nr:hypothetical protein [Candidatus Poribacteria bacterium]